MAHGEQNMSISQKFWNLLSGGVRVRFRVRFQAVKVPIFGGFEGIDLRGQTLPPV